MKTSWKARSRSPSWTKERRRSLGNRKKKSMQINEYQEKSMRTKSPTPGDRSFSPAEQQMLNAALGLSGEAGELVDYLKKGFFHGHEIDPVKIADETGDLLWYIAYLLDAVGLKLEDVMAQNVAKLERRYPGGFSVEDSKNRSAD